MARALTGLHLMAPGGESGSTPSFGVFSSELGGIPGLSGPTYPRWKEDVSCSVNESTSGDGVHEHSVDCRADEVIGQDWSSEVVALFLEDWELGRVALSCHMAMDLLCQEMRVACFAGSESLGSPWSLCSRCWEDSRAEEWEGREPGKSAVTASESLSPWAVTERRGMW